MVKYSLTCVLEIIKSSTALRLHRILIKYQTGNLWKSQWRPKSQSSPLVYRSHLKPQIFHPELRWKITADCLWRMVNVGNLEAQSSVFLYNFKSNHYLFLYQDIDVLVVCLSILFNFILLLLITFYSLYQILANANIFSIYLWIIYYWYRLILNFLLAVYV